MKLDFKINEDYLIFHTLSNMDNERFSSDKDRKDVVAFQDYAWEVDNDLYNVTVGRLHKLRFIDSIGIIKKKTQDILNKNDELDVYFDDLKNSKEFKIIKNQTQEYLDICEKQWSDNLERSSEIINELTGFDLNKSFDVFITHPSQKNGKYLGDNRIAWGRTEEYNNYTTIYLWHEILHLYFGKSDLEHAIIELITDNELRSRLNGEEYPPFEGHDFLNNLRKEILPDWRKYLKQDRKNIKTFVDSLN